MKPEIARLIDDKATRLALIARKRRNLAAVGGALLVVLLVMVAMLVFDLPISAVAFGVWGSFVILVLSPIVLTYGGVFRLRRLIKQNRLIEARKRSSELMVTCLKFFPYSALYVASTIQMELMLRESAYYEVEAFSRLLREAIQRFPYSKFTKRRMIPLFDNFQGMASLGLGDYEEARKMFSECLNSPGRLNRPVFLNNMGVCDLALCRYEDAYVNFTQAVEATPSFLRNQLVVSRIYPNLARACVKLSKLKEASELLQQSAEYFEKNKEENSIRASFFESLGLVKAAEGHFDEAEQHLRSAVELQHQNDELHPNLQDSRLELALVLDRLGKEKEASDLRKLVAENVLKLQLRLENASDDLLSSLVAGSHPIALLAK